MALTHQGHSLAPSRRVSVVLGGMGGLTHAQTDAHCLDKNQSLTKITPEPPMRLTHETHALAQPLITAIVVKDHVISVVII
jgi:hypothetical protein